MTTGLNPSSSSRFTLSIPLLGHANLVPLGSVSGRKRRKVGCVVLFYSWLLSGTDVVSFGRFGFGGRYYRVLRMNSRIKVLSSQFFRCTSPSFFHIANPSMGISLDSSSHLFCFLSDRSFDFERERQQLCQRVQFIYLHSLLSFFVSSYPRSLSLTDLNADGARFLETSVADGGTVADTSPSFSSTGQDESTSGAAAGVI
jgi:hypothetical protein